MASSIDIERCLTDERLLGAALGDIETWRVWLAVLKAAFALPLTAEEQTIFASVSGNRSLPSKRVRELWCVAGRRGGKSEMAAALAVHTALFMPHRTARGEKPAVLVLAASREQASVVFNYIEGFFEASPVLAREVLSSTASEIRLRNGVTISVHANSFRTVRGRTLLACIFDEVAFWRDETTAMPDTEMYSAILPSLITTAGMLIGISSPYRRIGLLHSKHKQYFGTNSDDTLVVSGSSQTFNPTLTSEAAAAAIEAQRQADPTASKSEWDAQFRDDLASFLDQPLIDSAVNRSRPLELPPRHRIVYKAFVDVSGGAIGGDAYSIGIAHKEDGIFVLDVVRGRQGPFDPSELTKEYAALVREYRIGSVTGDYYAAEFSTSLWRKQAISYLRSELPASQIYIESLPLFTRQLVSLPDHQPLLRELALLERSPTRMGKELVCHPRGCHDDLANAACGALRMVAKSSSTNWNAMLGYATEPEHPPKRHPATMTREMFERITRLPPSPTMPREAIEADEAKQQKASSAMQRR